MGLGLIGSALAGAVGGAGEAMASTAMEEQKQEMLRLRDEHLARLARETHAQNSAVDTKARLEEHRGRADIDIENAPRKGAAETAVQVDRRKALDPMDVEKAGNEARERKTVEGEFIDQDTRRAGLIAQAEVPAAVARIKATGDETRRTQREDDERRNQRDWKVDADGNYRRPDGSIVMEEIREGGKKLGERPVKAPKTKTEGGRSEVYSDEDKIKFVQQQITALQRKDFRTDEDEKDLLRLRREYDSMTGKKGASQPPANRPPLSSFNGK